MTHKTWWETEGSGMRPFSNEDIEEFAKRITAIAWSNGEYVEREACAKTLESISNAPDIKAYAAAIRARGEA